MTPRRIALAMALLVAVLVVLAAAANHGTAPAPPLPPPGPTATGRVVHGSLPADGTVSAREGEVVELEVRSDAADVAEIAALGVSGAVGPGTASTLTFLADRPGRFAVTLRYAQARIGTLDVRPPAS